MTFIQAFMSIINHWLNAFIAPLTQDDAEAGQSLVEYALLMILIGISAIVVIALLGPTIGNIFDNIWVNVRGAAE
jgi:pilus assembly protein Flp/PilA